jgi:hypothetical protein
MTREKTDLRPTIVMKIPPFAVNSESLSGSAPPMSSGMGLEYSPAAVDQYAILDVVVKTIDKTAFVSRRCGLVLAKASAPHR